jgi:hypothetical protein
MSAGTNVCERLKVSCFQVQRKFRQRYTHPGSLVKKVYRFDKNALTRFSTSSKFVSNAMWPPSKI